MVQIMAKMVKYLIFCRLSAKNVNYTLFIYINETLNRDAVWYYLRRKSIYFRITSRTVARDLFLSLFWPVLLLESAINGLFENDNGYF